MSRPIKQGLEYFPHDTDASSDEKIASLMALYGNDGYAFFFIMCERIYRTEDGELDISDAETRQILARKCHLSRRKFDKILESSVKLSLFSAEVVKNGKITSNGIKRRIALVTDKRRHERTRYEQEKDNTGVSAAETTQGKPTTETDNRNPAESTQTKVKKSIESKESKENTPPKKLFGEFQNVSLSDDEKTKLETKFGVQGAAEWVEKLSSWKRSTGKTKKDDYATILTWDRGDSQKPGGNGRSRDKPKDESDLYTNSYAPGIPYYLRPKENLPK